MSKRNEGNAAVCAREGYEAATALRALNRAGRCPQLKGHVHEIMFCDKFNVNPSNIMQGNHAALTKSATAKMKDVVITRGGKVIGHAQLKDTISNSGVRKTIEQINGGHYGQTAVYGTEETVAKIAGKVTQKVHSSGISSETTSRIAQKALGAMPSASALASVARSGGVVGAAVGAGVEAVSSLVDVANGKKSFGDAALDVGGAAVKGGVSGGAAAAAGSAAAGLTGSALTAAASTAAGSAALSALGGTAVGAAAVAFAPAVIGFGAACAVCSFISDLFD